MEGLPFTLFDAVVAAVVALSALVGLARGAVAEILGLASWIGAAVAAYLARPHATPLVREAVGNEALAELLAVAGVFLVALVAIKVVAGMIRRGVEGSALAPADRLLGLAFGVARGAALVVVGYLIASQFVRAEAQPAWVREARLIEPVERGAAALERYLPASEGLGDALPGAAERAQALESLLEDEPRR